MSYEKEKRKIKQPKKKEQKKLIDIFNEMTIKQKYQLQQYLFSDHSYNMSQEKKLKGSKFQEINKDRQKSEHKSKIANDKKIEPKEFDQNDIRDFYSILEMTLKQNFVPVNQSYYNSKITKKPLEFGKITLKSLSNVPYQFLFGGLIQLAQFKKLFIQDKDNKEIVEIAIQLFNHCQELRFPQIHLKFPEFKNFFKTTQIIRFPNLRSLSLQNCAIQSIESLSFMDLPVLGVLNLQSNMISRIDSLAKLCFQNKFFQILYLRGNFINEFSKFHRINMKKLINFRLNGQVLFSPKQKDIQSEDLSFLVKKSFSTQTIRTYTQKRISQQKVIDCLYKIDQKVYIYKV